MAYTRSIRDDCRQSRLAASGLGFSLWFCLCHRIAISTWLMIGQGAHIRFPNALAACWQNLIMTRTTRVHANPCRQPHDHHLSTDAALAKPDRDRGGPRLATRPLARRLPQTPPFRAGTSASPSAEGPLCFGKLAALPNPRSWKLQKALNSRWHGGARAISITTNTASIPIPRETLLNWSISPACRRAGDSKLLRAGRSGLRGRRENRCRGEGAGPAAITITCRGIAARRPALTQGT